MLEALPHDDTTMVGHGVAVRNIESAHSEAFCAEVGGRQQVRVLEAAAGFEPA